MKTNLLHTNNFYPFGVKLRGRTFEDSTHRNGFNGKEFDVETETQDYGERVVDNDLGLFLSVDPLMKKYPELSTYQYASNTPIWGTDWDGLEVRIYTETSGLGHAFLTVGSGKDLVVYTYGRYLGGDKEKPSSNSLDPSGRGVLIRLTGKEAQRYVKHELNDMSARAFEITDSDEGKSKEFYDKIYSNARKLTKEEAAEYDSKKNKYGTSEAVRVVDAYLLLSNNCVDKAVDAAKAGGTKNDFKEDVPSAGVDIPPSTADVISPKDLEGYLIGKTYEEKSSVVEVTNVAEREGKAAVKARANKPTSNSTVKEKTKQPQY